MIRVVEAVGQLPAVAQHSTSWAAVAAAVSSFVGLVQGPLAVLASVLSVAWLACQIWLFFKNKPWRKNAP